MRHLAYLYLIIVIDTREILNLKINDTSTKWIVLSWESPCNDATILIMYHIERCDSKNCNETNESNTWHNATELDPCTWYTFKVKILTDFWKSEGVTLSTATDGRSH